METLSRYGPSRALVSNSSCHVFEDKPLEKGCVKETKQRSRPTVKPSAKDSAISRAGSHLELGPDAVGTRYEDGVDESCCLQVEEPSESPEFGRAP